MSDTFAPVRARGYVKWYNREKGYGFLIAEGLNRDCFVHRQQLVKSGLGDVVEDQPLTFVIRDGPKGHFAVDLQKVEVK
jgi:CspA family cold shock protein